MVIFDSALKGKVGTDFASYVATDNRKGGQKGGEELAGLVGQKKFVGFDTSAPLVQGLRQDKIHALVAQDPTKMGYEAVSTMVKHLKGEKVPEYTDTGARLVTKGKLEDPEIKKLIGG